MQGIVCKGGWCAAFTHKHSPEGAADCHRFRQTIGITAKMRKLELFWTPVLPAAEALLRTLVICLLWDIEPQTFLRSWSWLFGSCHHSARNIWSPIGDTFKPTSILHGIFVEIILHTHTHYLLPKQNINSTIQNIIKIWQAARGAEAHQCWPPMVTSSNNIMNVYKKI